MAQIADASHHDLTWTPPKTLKGFLLVDEADDEVVARFSTEHEAVTKSEAMRRAGGPETVIKTLA